MEKPRESGVFSFLLAQDLRAALTTVWGLWQQSDRSWDTHRRRCRATAEQPHSGFVRRSL